MSNVVNRRDFLRLGVALPLASAAHANTYGMLDWSRTAQEIDGFGVSAAFQMAQNLKDFPEPKRGQVLDALFSQTRGAGFSIVRNFVGDGGSWGTPIDGPAPSIEPQEGVWNWTGDEEEIWFMQEAAARGCSRYLSTVWSPPSRMKDNHSVIGGRLRRDKYQAFAEYPSMYVRGYKEHHGIEIYAISPTNEPDITVKYSSCYWTGEALRTFLKEALIPVFARDKITAKLVLGEHSTWSEEPAVRSLDDPDTALRVDIVGTHAYVSSRMPFPPVSARSGNLSAAQQLKKKIWQTEVGLIGRNVPGIRDGLYWAKLLHTHVAENGLNAWFYWWAVSPYTSGGCLIHLDPKKKAWTADKRLYALGNYSRFVRPGYFRVNIEADFAPGVLVSAFKNEQLRQLVVVAINENAGARDLEISVTGIGVSAAGPYRTSETEDLAALPVVSIANNALKAALAPRSVTTFVASVTANSDSARPAQWKWSLLRIGSHARPVRGVLS